MGPCLHGSCREGTKSPWSLRAPFPAQYQPSKAWKPLRGEPLPQLLLPGRCGCPGPGVDKRNWEIPEPPGVRAAFVLAPGLLVLLWTVPSVPDPTPSKVGVGRSSEPGVLASKCGHCFSAPFTSHFIAPGLSSLSWPRETEPPGLEEGTWPVNYTQDVPRATGRNSADFFI